ncbi:MAG: sensor histidine kinase [Smithellaceae bacterium]|nr:sensor histidine kinase [Smithellaceae bacterium]
MKKLVSYLPFVALFLLPLLFYPGVDASGWRSGSDVHAFFEFASALLAITAGIMVLLHFFTTGRWFFLIISIGFVLIGGEEFVHAIFSFHGIWSEKPPAFELAISTTWLTGHFILLTWFFIALILGKKEIVPAKRGPTAVVYNIIGLIFAAAVAVLIFNIPFLPDFVQLGSITKKLIELSLALLYFVAFLFYSNIYVKQQPRSPLLWSITAFIIVRVLAHIFVFDAQAFYDSHWDAAHLIVLLSYFFPIFGVWGEIFKSHASAQVQVIKLEKEITARKQAEEELRTSHFQFRALAQRLLEIREEEGVKLAREIHDEMGGGLTGLKMDLSWLLRKMGDADPGKERTNLMDRIQACHTLIDHMIQVVRRVSTDLRPSVLDDLGLIAALERQLSEFTNRTEIPHEFTTTFEYISMEENTALAIFRIFQEALTNVVRHARATKVAVVLREGEQSLFGDESLVLEIRDNGRGITEEEIMNSESFGLLGMKERVLAFGGELSIRAQSGGGTALVLQIPRKQGGAS